VFEKVGEATETALIVLAEKMNPFSVGKTGLDRRGAAIAVRQDMETKWKKVGWVNLTPYTLLELSYLLMYCIV